MYRKVLLADDNPYALEHFQNLVSWEDHGFTLAGTALDGLEAMEVFERELPDLVITDVEMPGLDGIELAKRIRAIAPQTVILFLSSYDAFDYARAAIDLNVHSYLLKQELTGEMLAEKLLEIRSFLETAEQEKRSQTAQALVAAFHTAPEELAGQPLADQPLFPQGAAFFLLEQDHLPPALAQVLGHQTEPASLSFFQGACQELGIPYFLHLEEYSYLGVLPLEELWQKKARRIWSMACEKASFTLLCGRAVPTIGACKRAVEQLGFFQKTRYFEGIGADLAAADLLEPVPLLEDQVHALLEKAEELFQEGCPLHERLRSLAEPLIQRRDYDAFQRLVFYVLHRIREERRKNSLPDPGLSRPEWAPTLLSVPRILSWIEANLSDYHAERFPRLSRPTRLAMEIIKARYADPLLGIEDVAREAGVSVNRLGECMKQDLSMTPGRYLTQTRLQAARDLLEKGQSIAQVSLAADYSSSSYFSHAFKGAFGISPQKYQKERGH